MNKIIEFKNVSERYRIRYTNEGKSWSEEFLALNDVSFSIDKGEAVGIIGKNGAGKSTILKLISGMLKPDKGSVETKGKVSALMELGAGFNPEFTGRENIVSNAQAYGISGHEIHRRLDRIIEFAELGKFIDAPVKYYSQGMYARLGFSLAIHVDPDILLVDDILAVGDESFQRKCRNKIYDMKKDGKTIVLVSHDMNTIEALSDRVMFLNEGRVVSMDRPLKAMSSYLEKIGQKDGIVVLREGDLRLAFNNGKVFISYKDNPLGKNQYSSFILWNQEDNKWSSSIEFKWEIAKKGPGFALLKGRFREDKVKCDLKITLDKEQLVFDLKIKTKDGLKTQGLHWDFIISQLFDRYFFGSDYFSFPAFSSRQDWQEIFRVERSNCIGFASANKELPCILVEKSSEDRINIFNTGYDTEKRAVSVWTDGGGINCRLCFFASDGEFEERMVSLFEDFNHALRKNKEKLFRDYSITCGPLTLFADPQTKSVHLHHKDQQLTTASGIECSFTFNGKFFNAFYSTRFIPSREGDNLVIDIEWQGISVSQRWKFHFGDSNLFWDLSQHKSQEGDIEEFKMSFLLSHKYRYYFCGGQEAAFPDDFSVWQELPLAKPFSGFCGVRKLNFIPALAMNNVEGGHFMVQQSDVLTQCHAIQILLSDELINQDNFNIAQKTSIYDDESFLVHYINDQLRKNKEKLFRDYSITCGPLTLFADPQTKSVHLHHKDQQLTTASGIECSFTFNGKFFNAFYSTRFIPSREGDNLVIDIEWQGISVSQRWKFHFGDSNLFWDLSQHKSQEGDIEEFKVGLIVTDKYKRFFCGHQVDNFPEESDEWQDMHIEDPYSELEGVRKIDKLPALALENINQCACLIQNGNALVKCRSLQMKIDNNAANKSELRISQKISIYENETPVIQYVQDSLAKHKKRLFEQYAIGTGPFRLFADPQAKVIHLYHNGRQITGGPHGFFFGLETDPDNYDMSFLRDWQVERIDENFLRVVMTGQRAPKTEIFAFETNDKGIVIKLWVDNDAGFKLRDYHIKLELADNYKRWATSYGEGSFPEGREWVNSIMPARLKENQIDNIILKPDGADFPLLDIFCSFNTPRRFTSLYKRRQGDLSVVCLQYQFSFFDDESYYKSGGHDVFECTLTFQERGCGQSKDTARDIKLKNKDTSFIFARGLGRLFWKDREITSGLGVYSSLRSKGIWYDSSQAVWKAEKKTENILVAYGRWLFLPIHQRWSIELKKDRVLWTIDTEISGHIKPEIEQANIMTSEEYSEWSLSNGLKGRFDGFFTDDYDILPFRYCYVELESPLIRVSHANLPLLSFSCKNGKGLKAIVENSDVFYRSRIIQYQKTNDKNAADSDDKYKFFEGEIILK